MAAIRRDCVELLSVEWGSAHEFHRLEPGRLEIFDEQIFIVVLHLDRDDNLDSLATLNRFPIEERIIVIDHALEKRGPSLLLEVFAPDEDLVARGPDRLLQAEESSLGCNVESS